MAADNHSWTIGDTGRGNGPKGSDDSLPGGQIDFKPDFKNARQDVPYEFDFHKLADVSGSPGRVDVPDPIPHGLGVPDPGCGDKGQPVDFGAVAPDTDRGVEYDLEGMGGSGHGGFALGDVPD